VRTLLHLVLSLAVTASSAAARPVIISATESAGTTYFVAPPPAGDDASTGTEQAPFATIQRAADVAVAGDTIVVLPGAYAGAKFTRSGAAGAPITVRAMAGAVVVAPGPNNSNLAGIWISNAGHVVVENFEVAGVEGCGIVAAAAVAPGNGPPGIVLRGNYVHDTGFGGLAVNGPSGAQVLDNEVANVAGQPGLNSIPPTDGLFVSGNVFRGNALGAVRLSTVPSGDTPSQPASVIGNTCFDNGAGGAATILLQGAGSCLVANNLLFDNHGRGIDLVGQQDGAGAVFNRVFNNTVVQASDGAAPLAVRVRSTNNTAFNNILLHPAGLATLETDSSSAAGFQSDHNNLPGPVLLDGVAKSLAEWQALGYDANSISASAAGLFVDAAAHEFALRADSPAVDTGRFVSGVSADIRGVARPQGEAYDVGAYEYAEPGPENHAPVAMAGADRTVTSGSEVRLDAGGSSDPDGDVLQFVWTQTSGTVVALADATSAAATFTAPPVATAEPLTFRVTVGDGRGGEATDDVTITVEPVAVPAITVLAPVGGEVWTKMSARTVRWVADAAVSGDCRIELSRDGGETFEVIVASVDVMRGKRKWTVKGPRTTAALVRIVFVADPRVQGVSPSPFTIRR
jgi:hypothetical protein